MQATSTTHGTSTHGWDTVYAVRFPDLNKTIISHKTSPTTFEQALTDEGDEYKVSGLFGDWQLTAGGDGKNVHLAVPITKSTFQTNHTYDCDLITLIIEVNLLWVTDHQQPAASTASRQQLQMGAGGQAADDVAIIRVEWGTTKLGELSKAAYTSLLRSWLTKHIGAFRQVFSTIDLNKELSDKAGALQWLMPTGKPMYAVVDKDGDLQNSVFGVLCMTENRPEPGNHQIDPFAIPEGANSGFLISPERVLSNMLRPGIPGLFMGHVWEDDFPISPDGLSLTNHVALQFARQQLENGTLVQPEVDRGNFVLEMAGSQLNMRIDGLHFEYSPGIKVSINHTSQSKLRINKNNHLVLDMVGEGTTSANISTEKWVIIAEVIGSIAAAIILAAIGGAIGARLASAGTTTLAEGSSEAAVTGITTTVSESAGEVVTNLTPETLQATLEATEGSVSSIRTLFATPWAKVFGALGSILGGMTGMSSQFLELAAKGNASEIPTLDNFSTQALSPITWPNTAPDGLALVSGQLNGALQLGFNLTYHHA